MDSKEKRKKLLKYLTSKELLLYLVFGILTTAINWAVYFILTDAVKMNVSLAYFIAWAVSVIVAFLTNKKYVFMSSTRQWKTLLFEAGTFVGGRLLTLIIGEILMTVFVGHFGQSNLLWKFITTAIEVVGNWLVSKFITFKKKAD